ncbi:MULTISPECIES: putative quinol monooxygenase [Chelatococcus]|uniref:Quinol monooxygenase YgiN n=1 Tax=Chelatococcus caeni TaxID=1348468 RepID=A0A840BR74_9HYPH|nr:MULTISPECIES: putative quinol monooxygenase [Chelatococcus]MBB4015113.1 quinol monooxygenase YgiN [Chelatococcus caeni]
MSEVHMVAVLYAKTGKEKELRNDLTVITEKSRKEEGNLEYDLFEDRNDPRRFVLIEHWRGATDQDRHHNQSDHIRHFHDNGDRNVERREAIYLLQKVV